MKNIFIYLSFFFSFFLHLNTVFALKITGITDIAASLYDDKRGSGPKVQVRAKDLVRLEDDTLSFVELEAIKDLIDFSFERRWVLKIKNYFCYTRIGEHREKIFFHINGVLDSVLSVIIIQDDKMDCAPYANGSITDPNNQYINNVYIESNIYTSDKKVTDGIIFCMPVPKNKLLFRPYKKDKTREGITTRDIILVQKYILGIESLSPLQLIAADVNLDRYISSRDIEEMKKLILGQIQGFVESWRFIPKNYKFPNPMYPWGAPNFLLVEAPTIAVDFTGILIGDVNFSNSISFNENDFQSRSSYSEELALEEESRLLDIKIKEKEQIEKRPIREIMIYELNINGSSVRAFKRYNNSDASKE